MCGKISPNLFISRYGEGLESAAVADVIPAEHFIELETHDLDGHQQGLHPMTRALPIITAMVKPSGPNSSAMANTAIIMPA